MYWQNLKSQANAFNFINHIKNDEMPKLTPTDLKIMKKEFIELASPDDILEKLGLLQKPNEVKVMNKC